MRCLLGAIGVALLSAAARSAHLTFALVGGTLVNPGTPPIPDAVIVVRDGRIVCAARRGTGCIVPSGARRIDVSGAFVSPGLIDAHVHYSQTAWVDGRPDAVDLRDAYPYDSVVAALEAHPEVFHRAYLCAGVTSVFDVGGYPWTFAMARRTIDATDAPRVVAAGPLLSTIDHWLNLPMTRQFVFMRDDSIVRAAVRADWRLGSGAVKVWYLQLPDSIEQRMKPLLMAAGDEARKVGLPLIVHATELATARDALEAGSTLLVHSVETDTVDAAFIEALKRNGAIVIPTLTVREGYVDVLLGRSPAARYPLDCVDAETRRKLASVIPEARRERGVARVKSGAWDTHRAIAEENLRRLVAAGIPIALGTDAGNPGTAPGPSVYREMEAMQQAGMSAPAVFASATIVAARAMGLERETGSIAPGKRADIVVFDADPTADIANARRVRLVMRNGVTQAR